MYDNYVKGISYANNQTLSYEFDTHFNTTYNDKNIRYIKNRYELIRNLLSFSFFCKREISTNYFYIFNFNLLDNTNFEQNERICYCLEKEDFEEGAERIGFLSFLFGKGIYYLNKNYLKISSSFSLGLLWTRDNAMVLANYKYYYKYEVDNIGGPYYYANSKIKYVNVNRLINTDENPLEFLPFSRLTWMHGDILFKFEILSIQYKHFYVSITWKRGILDTIKVIKHKWWNCLASTLSVEIGYVC
jgi:hypothetical protein